MRKTLISLLHFCQFATFACILASKYWMKGNFEETYKALFRRYYTGLLFYATRLVGEDDAEDIVQDVFVEIWKRQDSVELGEQIQSFLYRSIYTKVFNLLKHKAVAENYSAAEVEFYQKRMEYYQPDHSEVIKRIENRELRSEIRQAIDGLPDKCKEVYKLSYLHDMKNKDIADVMGISLRTVEAHMYKALIILREKLSYLRKILLFWL